MFWKKKEKIYGHAVKFSEHTARENPTMIINEYNRLINEKREEIKAVENDMDAPVEIETKDFPIYRRFDDDTYFGRRDLLLGWERVGIKPKDILNKLTKKQISTVLNQYDKLLEEKSKLEVEKEDIVKELEWFESKYKHMW